MDYIKSRTYADFKEASKQAEQASWMHGSAWVVPLDNEFLVLASECADDAPPSFSLAFDNGDKS